MQPQARAPRVSQSRSVSIPCHCPEYTWVSGGAELWIWGCVCGAYSSLSIKLARPSPEERGCTFLDFQVAFPPSSPLEGGPRVLHCVKDAQRIVSEKKEAGSTDAFRMKKEQGRGGVIGPSGNAAPLH